MDVLSLPDFRASNPYQKLLAQALQQQDILVHHAPAGGLFVITRAWWPRRKTLRALHLHWPEQMIDARHAWGALVKTIVVLAELALLRRHLRVVVTAHNLFSHRGGIPRRLERFYLRGVYRMADQIVLHSPEAVRRLDNALGLDDKTRGRMVVAAHGHFASAYPSGPGRASARQRLQLESHSRCMLLLGDLRPNKGIGEFAASFTAWEADNVILLIAGEPKSISLRRQLDALAASDHRIRLFWGRVQDAQLGDYFDAADVVCFPYRDFLTSGAMILAMSFNKALMLPRGTSMGSVVDEEQQLAVDIDQPAAAFDEFASRSDAELSALGVRNGKRMRAMTWEQHAAICAACYRGEPVPIA